MLLSSSNWLKKSTSLRLLSSMYLRSLVMGSACEAERSNDDRFHVGVKRLLDTRLLVQRLIHKGGDFGNQNGGTLEIHTQKFRVCTKALTA